MSVSFDKQFVIIIESLMAGKFICKLSDPVSFEFMENESYLTQINDYLGRIERKAMRSQDGNVYCLIFNSINTDERRKTIRFLFGEIANEINPLVCVLKQVMSALQKEAPIQQGDVLRFGEILDAIDVTPALVEDLSLLTRSGLFETKKAATKDRLSTVFNKLVQKEYLIQQSASSSSYFATGKWSYFYECLDFLSLHESIAEHYNDEQLELL